MSLRPDSCRWHESCRDAYLRRSFRATRRCTWNWFANKARIKGLPCVACRSGSTTIRLGFKRGRRCSSAPEREECRGEIGDEGWGEGRRGKQHDEDGAPSLSRQLSPWVPLCRLNYRCRHRVVLYVLEPSFIGHSRVDVYPYPLRSSRNSISLVSSRFSPSFDVSPSVSLFPCPISFIPSAWRGLCRYLNTEVSPWLTVLL